MTPGTVPIARRGRLPGGRFAALAVTVAVGLSLTSCTPVTNEPPSPVPRVLPTGVPVPVGEGTNIATDLAAPWSIALLADATMLVSERDTGQVLEVSASGARHAVGSVAGVVHAGEGGLLGLATRPASCEGNPEPDPATGCLHVFAYFTTATDNRIVRMPLVGRAGSRSLGPATVILQGLARAGNHNGGRIVFGPDGMLYVTSGDAGNGPSAQDPSSLSGKILRLTPDGGVPGDNPFPGSLVYSLGHRNAQGIAWDSRGRMWASEFGQNTWDELNEIKPGGNYGWPEVEGMHNGDLAQYINPVLVWSTDEASPSGIAIRGTTLYMAALRGARLWVIDLAGTPRAQEFLSGELGRLRDVVLAPDGRLWVMTNNTDGRGSPSPGDDRIVAFNLAPS